MKITVPVLVVGFGGDVGAGFVYPVGLGVVVAERYLVFGYGLITDLAGVGSGWRGWRVGCGGGRRR